MKTAEAMCNLEKWIRAILNEDADNLSLGSVRTLQMIKHEFERMQKELAASQSNEDSPREIIENLLDAIPKQTPDADWWDDSLTQAVAEAKKWLNGTKPDSPRWVSVEKEFPEEDKWVLAWNGFWTGVCKRTKHHKDDPDSEMEWVEETGEYINTIPTHWMPLPSPPKSEITEENRT